MNDNPLRIQMHNNPLDIHRRIGEYRRNHNGLFNGLLNDMIEFYGHMPFPVRLVVRTVELLIIAHVLAQVTLNISKSGYQDGTIRTTTIKTGLNDLSSGAIYDSLMAQQICPNPNDLLSADDFKTLIPHPFTDTPRFTVERCSPGTTTFDPHGLWGTGMGCSAQTSSVEMIRRYSEPKKTFEFFKSPYKWTICNYRCLEEDPIPELFYIRRFTLFQSSNNRSILVPNELRPARLGRYEPGVNTSICHKKNTVVN